CRPAAAETLLAAPGRGRAVGGKHPEVPAQAAQLCRLCAAGLLVRAMGAAARHFPGRRMRLEPTRRWPAAGGFAAHLPRRARRRAAAIRAGLSGEPGALSHGDLPITTRTRT